MKTLDAASRTLFSNFQENVFARIQIERSTQGRPTYVKKKIKGNIYWYSQIYTDGVAKQTYLGPDDEAMRARIIQARYDAKKEMIHLENLKEQERRTATMLAKAGLPILDRRMSVILSALSNARLIDENGLLVGTFAFSAYAGIFGMILDRASLRTEDIDIAQDPSIELAHPIIIDTSKFFSQPSLESRPIPPLSPKNSPASFITTDGIRIDFLIPLRGKAPKHPRPKNIIGAGATPLRFLDYLMEDPIRTVLLSTKGGIAVTIPSPERFTIHKLIVAAYRPQAEDAKKMKDIAQASQLIELLSEQPKELIAAYKLAISRGPKWKKAVHKSLNFVAPEIARVLA